MATFDEHITQARRNLQVLEATNQSIEGSWDWQVTMAFYVGVHLINGHIAKTIGEHYRSHDRVKNAINPYGLSPAKLPEPQYLAYAHLQSLSRRSRYLCHEKLDRNNEAAFLTYDKHLKKALHHLNNIMCHMASEYDLDLPAATIACPEIKSDFDYFKVPAPATT